MDADSGTTHSGSPLGASGGGLPQRRVTKGLLLALIVAVEAAWLVAIVVIVIWLVSG